MSYKVIHFFTDLQDNNHAYSVGDNFPRTGMKVSEARLKELASSNNRQHKPLIKFVEDVKEKAEPIAEPTVKEEVSYTKTEINRMSTAELKALADKHGLDSTLSGAGLKKLLVSYFGL